MAKQRLFPEPITVDKREPEERFEALATQVFTVPKAEIDKRERRWKRQRRKPKPQA